MKVNYQNNRDISFNGFLNNKILKKGLEFASENGTLFAATTTLALSGIRPLAILATPKTDKKNKQVACAKSLTSSINGYLIALICSLPLSRAIKRIDNKPKEFLKKETIQILKDSNKTLTESKAYSLATQTFKLGLGLLIAAPKSVLTALGMPYLLNIIENNNEGLNKKNTNNITNFKGKNNLSKGIGKILDNKNFQKFVDRFKDTNFPLHIVATTDIISTGVFINQANKSKNIQEKDKPALIYNSIISTVLSILSTYTIDGLTKKQTDEFIKRYKIANKKDPNLAKQIEGIKIAKPILIAGIVYYILIPIVSTFLADRIKINSKEA
ncbi:hypothetical protein IJ384_04345 [bacterium]|nr:hypothetical protein [bacterium]